MRRFFLAFPFALLLAWPASAEFGGYLRQSTQVEVSVCGFVDYLDGVTAETGVTLAGDQAELLKTNGAVTVDISAATWAAVTGASGCYDLTLTTSHTDTVGQLQIVIQDADVHLPRRMTYQVVEENVYDAAYVSGAALGTDIAAILVDTSTTLDNLVDDLEARLGTPSDLGGGATVAANLSDIEGQTDDIGAAGAGLTAIPWNAAWDAEVESEVTDAIEADGLDHLVSAAVTGTDVADNSIVADLVSSSATADYDTFVNTTDSLQAISDSGGGGPTAAAIADAVWDEARAGHATAGTFGEGVLVEDLNATADAAVNTQVDGAIETYHLDHLLAADYDPASKPGTATALLNELVEDDAGVSRFTTNALEQGPSSGLTVAGIADGVWDEARSGHVSAGTFGEGVLVEDLNTAAMAAVNLQADGALQDIGLDHLVSAPVTGTDVADDSVIAQIVGDDATADWDTYDNTTDSLEATGNNLDIMQDDGVATFDRTTDSLQALSDGGGGPTVAAIADGVWDEARSGHVAAGSFGTILSEYDPPTAAELTSEINDVQSDIGALNDLSAAQVNTEVLDVLTVDTLTLPGQEAPPASPTFEEMVAWLYKVLRNKVDQTSSTWQLYDDTGTTVDAKRTVTSTSTTTTLDEIGAGP